MARKASSLSNRSSLTRMKNSCLPGADAPLLNDPGCGVSACKDPGHSFSEGSLDQDGCGMNSVGTTCSKGSSFARWTFKAWRCFGVGPVLRVVLYSLTRSLDTSRSRLESFGGTQRGKSRGVAGGGGSRGLLLSFCRAAEVKHVSDSQIHCISSKILNIAAGLPP